MKIVVKSADPKTGKLHLIWKLFYPGTFVQDGRAAQQVNVEVGPTGRHSLPRFISTKADLLVNGNILMLKTVIYLMQH